MADYLEPSRDHELDEATLDGQGGHFLRPAEAQTGRRAPHSARDRAEEAPRHGRGPGLASAIGRGWLGSRSHQPQATRCSGRLTPPARLGFGSLVRHGGLFTNGRRGGLRSGAAQRLLAEALGLPAAALRGSLVLR